MNVKNKVRLHLAFKVVFFSIVPLLASMPATAARKSLMASGATPVAVIVKKSDGTLQVLDSQGTPVPPYGRAEQLSNSPGAPSGPNGFLLTYDITPYSTQQSSSSDTPRGAEGQFMLRPASYLIKVQSNYRCEYKMVVNGQLVVYPPGCNPSLP